MPEMSEVQILIADIRRLLVKLDQQRTIQATTPAERAELAEVMKALRSQVNIFFLFLFC